MKMLLIVMKSMSTCSRIPQHHDDCSASSFANVRIECRWGPCVESLCWALLSVSFALNAWRMREKLEYHYFHIKKSVEKINDVKNKNHLLIPINILLFYSKTWFSFLKICFSKLRTRNYNTVKSVHNEHT